MTMGSIYQEDIKLINIHTPNIRASKYIKQILTELSGGTNSKTVIIGDFNTPLSTWIDHPDRKINK